MKWWSNPKQRQRWHSSEILPSDTDNWGQIFFDLFFVGGAYNLGNVLKTSNSLDRRALLYFFATGFPSMVMWHDKLSYDARFTTRPGRDVFHRTLEVVRLCCVATALSRIRSVEVESHPCNHIDIFEFATAVFLNSALTIGRYVEVMCFVEGDPGARAAARRDVLCRVPPALFLLAAAVESAMSSFGRNGDHDEGCDVNEKPIWYCLASWASGLAIGYLDKVTFAPKGRREQIETTSVPLNVQFCTHRYGEWFMLMFGESIMSLVIVEGNNETLNHNLKFYAGMLSVTCLASLHFKSEPGIGEDHALSRSRSSNYFYTQWLVPIYSMALIATGVCYKMFLYNYNDVRSGDDDDYMQLEQHEQDTANLFSRSLVLALVCTDLNLLLHRGTQDTCDRIRLVPRCKFVLLVVLKVSYLISLGAMSYLQNDPHFMAMFGLGGILLQDALRRSFKAWQRKEMVFPSNEGDSADGGAADVKETPQHSTDRHPSRTATTTLHLDDEDYQFKIERFETAEVALAKFERRSAVDGIEGESGPTHSPMTDLDGGPSLSGKDPGNKGVSADSYYQL